MAALTDVHRTAALAILIDYLVLDRGVDPVAIRALLAMGELVPDVATALSFTESRPAVGSPTMEGDVGDLMKAAWDWGDERQRRRKHGN